MGIDATKGKAMLCIISYKINIIMPGYAKKILMYNHIIEKIWWF